MTQAKTNYYYTVSDNLAAALTPHLGIYAGYAAGIISHIDYWLTKNEKAGFTTSDGKKWIYNTYGEWCQKFTYLSVDIIGRMIRKLEEIGIIITRRFDELSQIGFSKSPSHFLHYDRTKWYRLNYKALNSLLTSLKSPSRANLQSDMMESASLQDATCSSAASSIQNLPNQITKNNNTSVVDLKNDQEEWFGQMGRESTLISTQHSVTQSLEGSQTTYLSGLRKTELEQFSAPPDEDVKKCYASRFDAPEQPAPEEEVESAVKETKPTQEEASAVNEKASDHLDQLDQLGIRLNPTLVALVRTTRASLVEMAIAAYQEYKRNHYVKNPVGFVVSAIKNRFNFQHSGDEANFPLWYEWMKKLGHVRGWEQGDDDFLVEDGCGYTKPYRQWIAQGWTLEYLQKVRQR